MYKDYITFTIMDQKIHLISDECYFGRNTVAEINFQYYYLGGEIPNIAAAIFIWQEINKKELDTQELRQVMIVNKIL